MAMPAPCIFFQQGRCNAGSKCKFDHDPSVLKRKPIAPGKAPCRFFAGGKGYCAAGDACQYAHITTKNQAAPATGNAAAQRAKPRDLPVGFSVPPKSAAREGWRPPHQDRFAGGEEDLTYSTETFTIGPDVERGQSAPDRAGSDANQASYSELASKNVVLQPELDHRHLAAADHSYPGAAGRQAYSDEQLSYKAFVKAEIASSVDLECGICLDKVLARSGEKFGLLDGCNHVYCLSCIREWRSVSELEKDVKRSCPQCRETSHWVIPSSFFPRSAEVKDRVATTYSDRLSQIHCKHFNHGDGECPFGTSCFYRHEYRDGTVQRYEPPRLRLNEEGELQAVGELKLYDLIVPQTRSQPR